MTDDSRPTDSEDEQALLFLQSPFGDEPDQREHQWAVDYLMSHADRMHPRLVELLQSGQASNPHAVIDVLPTLGRPESIPVLAELLRSGPPGLAGVAASALGRHPDPSALASLTDGLRSARPETVAAIADALLERGDSGACPAVVGALDNPDSIVRYHLVQSAIVLGCLERDDLAAIARSDPDDEVRQLAHRATQPDSP